MRRLTDLEAQRNRSSNVLFVVVRYHGGSDVCWEPDESFHVVRMAR
jgi:hypothetical protein